MKQPIHPKLALVTDRIIARSKATRDDYVARMQDAARRGQARGTLSCGNLAHAFAASPIGDRLAVRSKIPNIGIITSYNDMLSAHQPFHSYPDIIKDAARRAGGIAQVAGGVPAMCDGVTQGQPGMELSLFSRDVIAQATAVSLSHNVFDAVLCLGVCDKIVPGLLIGALLFGHLPTIFVPAGPMPSGIPNKEKARVRNLYAENRATREELLTAESASYHTAGTCTFYGTANSNQMLMEFMGLHMPGTAFVNPGTKLREALTRAAAARAIAMVNDKAPVLWEVATEKAFVNGIVGLLATGGSTNHTIHLVAMARAAGIILNWDDFDDLSECVPLLARVYPNGDADVNQFHAAGGLALVIRELLEAGLLHDDVATAVGTGLSDYTKVPVLNEEGALAWQDGVEQSLDEDIVRSVANPFSASGGLRVLHGNLGRAVIKISAVAPEDHFIEAPARIFDSQNALLTAFDAGQLSQDMVAVIRFQGPRANGMPELHKLTPTLSVLRKRGHKVALISDGRMSGASGKIAAAIHLSPEASVGGPLARLRDGDVIRLDANAGTLEVLVDAATLAGRAAAIAPDAGKHGMGRELFAMNRANVSSAETGALSILPEVSHDGA